jgi:CheY-like chemotaxis protein
LAQKLGLATAEQIEEAWEELGNRGGAAEPWLRLMERRGFLTPYQTAKLLKGDTDGFVLGGYRLLYKIASGSFGRVYRADDPRTGNVVAIKVLRRKWSEDKHNIELFEREGKMGMTLRHPNIVEILAVNRDPVSKQYYIVMEFVEGGNLRDFLGIRKKLEPAETLRILEDAVTGLAHAYSKGFSHRDMKLTNVLVSSQGVAKLVDFGLAGDHGPSPAALAATRDKDELQVDRTVDYAGLEKCTGVVSGDIRSDIYFLGCVVYELLTGRSPLEMTKDPRARMNRERFLRVKPMGKEEVNGPAAVFRLVETMMALNPTERYQTPSQLLDAIRDVRRELEGKNGKGAAGPRTLFIVEKDARLQDALREKFKEEGYRVLMAADPTRALDRFRQQPYDALIVDAGTTGEEGAYVFDRILGDAKRHELACAGILILSEAQAQWADKVEATGPVAVLVRPVTLKQLRLKLAELVGAPAE